MLNRNYIIITPCKNEEGNLPKLINSVVSQTITPKLWLIFDDGSEDNSAKIIEKATKKYDWIKLIKLPSHKRDLTKHICKIINEGFKKAILVSKKKGINYRYLANLDADIILSKNYYGQLIKSFEDNPKLGILRGDIYYPNPKGKLVLEKVKKDAARGAIKLFRRKCFEDIGGIPIIPYYGWDSAVNIKAMSKGWKVDAIDSTSVIHTRPINSVEGLWKGWKRNGESGYFFNVPIIFALIKSIKYTLKSPHSLGVAYFVGYTSSLMRGAPHVNDETIRRYYRRTRTLRNLFINQIKKDKKKL